MHKKCCRTCLITDHSSLRPVEQPNSALLHYPQLQCTKAICTDSCVVVPVSSWFLRLVTERQADGIGGSGGSREQQKRLLDGCAIKADRRVTEELDGKLALHIVHSTGLGDPRERPRASSTMHTLFSKRSASCLASAI